MMVRMQDRWLAWKTHDKALGSVLKRPFRAE